MNHTLCNCPQLHRVASNFKFCGPLANEWSLALLLLTLVSDTNLKRPHLLCEIMVGG
jgi:hypothetical protein